MAYSYATSCVMFYHHHGLDLLIILYLIIQTTSRSTLVEAPNIGPAMYSVGITMDNHRSRPQCINATSSRAPRVACQVAAEKPSSTGGLCHAAAKTYFYASQAPQTFPPDPSRTSARLSAAWECSMTFGHALCISRPPGRFRWPTSSARQYCRGPSDTPS